jgi:hypothetical protein
MTAPGMDAGDDAAVNRSTLAETIAAGRLRLETALAAFGDAAMLDVVDEPWTRKDVLAHLEAWERRVVGHLGTLRSGDRPDGSVQTDVLNERFYRENRDRSLDDVRAGEREAYDALLAAIDGASDEELFDTHHFPWTDGDSLADWFRGNSDEHYDEHLEQLTRPAR